MGIAYPERACGLARIDRRTGTRPAMNTDNRRTEYCMHRNFPANAQGLEGIS